MVWLARFQRRQRVRCKLEGGHGVLEFLLDGYVRCVGMDATRFQACEEVEHGGLVFGRNQRAGSSDAGQWVYHSMGKHRPWRCDWRCVQLCDKEYVRLLLHFFLRLSI